MTSSPSKVCPQCKTETPLSGFYRNKGTSDGVHSWCKVCSKRSATAWAKANPDQVRANGYACRRRAEEKKNRIRNWVTAKYNGTPCMDCDGVFNWCSMDFDHRPGEVKEFSIGQQGFQKATSERIVRVQKEISKCDLICANCHRVRTQERRNEAE